MEYYIAIDKEDIIWGVGLTKSEALEDGKAFFGENRELKIIKATKEVYEQAQDLDLDCPWHYDFENEIAFFPEKPKRENVFGKIK